MGQIFKPSVVNGAKNSVIQHANYDGYTVVPSDSAALPNGPTNAIYVVGAGNVAVRLADGGSAVLTGLSAGQTLEIAVTQVLATGTTATGISALYRS
jgi:hypothetical protein